MLSSPENWFWDFWFARNESEYHIFYLQAPKSLEYEEQRHHNATIGHAVSKNLFQWQVLEPITDPGEFGQLEIPQLVNIKDIYYLLFSTSAEHYSAHRIKHTKNKVVTGTHFLYQIILSDRLVCQLIVSCWVMKSVYCTVEKLFRLMMVHGV